MKRICLSLTCFLFFFNMGLSQWVQTNGPEGGFVEHIAVSGTNVFASSFGGGVFRSTNGGASWTSTNTGLPSMNVECLALNGDKLFVGLSDSAGVYLSTNNGATWNGVGSRLMGTTVYALAASGTNLFAATDGGMFLTTNSGATWTRQNSGKLGSNVLIAQGANLFAVSGGAVIITSKDNGRTWTNADSRPSNPSTGSPYPVFSLLVAGTNLIAGTYIGVYVSNNSGVSWIERSSGLTNEYIYSLALSGTDLFAGSSDGVFRSTDDGMNWAPATTGIPPNTTVYALGTNGTSIFAGTSAKGMFISTNSGEAWTATNSGLVGSYAMCLAGDGVNLFAGTWGGGVFLSTNGGESWSTSNTGLTYMYISSLLVNGRNVIAGTYEGVFLSTNSGTSWTATNAGLMNKRVYALAMSGANVYAGTDSGVFVSMDGGGVWRAVNKGLTWRVSALAVDGNTLFAGGSGVSISTNGGTSWSATSINQSVDAIAIMGGDVFAAIGDGNVAFSKNKGATWTAVNIGTTIYVSSFAVSDSCLLAAAYYKVFLSTNRGASWRTFDTGLSSIGYQSLTVSGRNLFSGSTRAGVWRRPLSDALTPTPAAPSLVSPPNGAIEVPITSMLGWNASPGATSYQLQISKDSLFSTSVVNQSGITDTFYPVGALADKTLYYWRVDASNAGGVSSYSTTSRFTTGFGISVNPKSMAFSGVLVSANKVLPLTVKYGGRDTIHVTNVVSLNQAFSVDRKQFDVWAEKNEVINIKFTPTSSDQTSSLLLVFHSLPTSPDTVSVSGSGLNAAILQVAGKDISLGTVLVNQSKDTVLVLNNVGTISLQVSRIISSNAAFSVRRTSMIIAPAQSNSDTVTFSPLVAGPVNGLLLISSNSTTSPDTVRVSGFGTTSTYKEDEAEIPRVYRLIQNYPNPFNPSTTIRYELPKATNVSLKIFNTLGQQVAALVNEKEEAGSYEVQWSASNVPSGVYLYRLQAGDYVETKKLVVLK